MHDDSFDRTDTICRGDLIRLAATLDVPAPERTPVLWHWTAFLDRSATVTLGPDGHPRAGGLIPEPPYPRRVFAGGRLTVREPLPVGAPIRRLATVGAVTRKEGRRGPLALVTVALDYEVEGEVLVHEEQDLAYLPAHPSDAGGGTTVALGPRGPGRGPAVDVAAGDPVSDDGSEAVTDAVSFGEAALFRFSALTFNAHRIHYDRDYSVGTEGHPDLVVHGPLLIIRLLELVRRLHGDAGVAALSFRARSPTYVGRALNLSARLTERDGDLEVRDSGRLVMDAKVELRAS